MGAVLTALGAALPEKTLDNAELAARLDVTEDWIFARTGIRTRHVVGDDESSASLATTAAHRVLEHAEIDPERIDLIIVATCSGDYQLPATAPLVANAIGAKNAGAFDMNAAC